MRLAGDDPERAGDAGPQLDLLDPARRLGADVVVVARLAADHGAQAGDPGEPAGLGAPAAPRAAARRRPGPRRVDRGRRHAGIGEALHGAVREPLGEVAHRRSRRRSRTRIAGRALRSGSQKLLAGSAPSSVIVGSTASRLASARCSSWISSSSSGRPWWWSVWPRRSRLVRRYSSLCGLGTAWIGSWSATERP